MFHGAGFRILFWGVFFCLCAWGNMEKPSEAAQPLFHSYAKPAPPPDFAVEDLNGKQINFKDRTGDVVLVNFWATW